MIKGVIFDVDGVLINTESIHYSAFKQLLSRYGYDLTHEGYKKHFSGKSIQGGILSLMQETNIKHNLSPDEFVKFFSREKIKATKKLFQKKLVFFKDTIDFIKSIKEGSISLRGAGEVAYHPLIALTTGLEEELVREVLKHHDLNRIIGTVVTAGQYAKSKPDPECYLLTLRKMELSAQDVVGIEDSTSGIKALKAAGIAAICIINTHTSEELKDADIVTSSLMELIQN